MDFTHTERWVDHTASQVSHTAIIVTPITASTAATVRILNCCSSSNSPPSNTATMAWVLTIGEAILAGTSEKATLVSPSPAATNSPPTASFGRSARSVAGGVARNAAGSNTTATPPSTIGIQTPTGIASSWRSVWQHR